MIIIKIYYFSKIFILNLILLFAIKIVLLYFQIIIISARFFIFFELNLIKKLLSYSSAADSKIKQN